MPIFFQFRDILMRIFNAVLICKFCSVRIPYKIVLACLTYTNDIQSQKFAPGIQIQQVSRLIAVYQWADGIQNVSVGILRGIQDVKIIMPIAFLSYIVFNLPVGYLLGFTLGMGAQGLILGFTVGLTTAAVLLIVRYRRDIRRWKAGIR